MIGDGATATTWPAAPIFNVMQLHLSRCSLQVQTGLAIVLTVLAHLAYEATCPCLKGQSQASYPAMTMDRSIGLHQRPHVCRGSPQLQGFPQPAARVDQLAFFTVRMHA